MGEMLCLLLGQVAVTFLAQKALRALGKRDYSDVVKFTGICICGVTGIEVIQFFLENSHVINFFKKIF